MNFINTFTADSTTAELACESLGVTRSQMLVVVGRKRQEINLLSDQTSAKLPNANDTDVYFLPLGFAIITRCVVGQAVKDKYLAPLCALIQGCQQLVDGLRVQVH